MSDAAPPARDERGEVVAVETFGDIVEVTVRLPHLAAEARPGQFAQVRCSDSLEPLLRRPFSVAWTEGDLASFVLAPVGVGTRRLAALRPGDELSVLGPLGRGFTVDAAASHHLCVCGGLGCAPFPLLIRTLRAAGGEVTVINGASRERMLYPRERLVRGDDGVRVVELTVDGSRGTRGVVTDALADHPVAATAVFVCGPNAMLAAVAARLDTEASPPLLAEASLEAPMGCGYGTCLGCALPVRAPGGGTRWALCCRDGPVLPMHAVDWTELMELPPASVA